ncbi:Cupredoxin [Leucosporidium creatinivorum]|uniref:Cupredoxin n=1 Tax=Leucosporidium creatinivorum TaxID=106004 RepID=A0A1Y2ELY9_9BASI|nr:Cupredoxin [Leucosporidium creatinivorum]
MLSFHPFSFTLSLLCSFVTSSLAANHQIVVGGTGLVFTPEETTAAVGDTVEFIFQPPQHTVTQSSFADPCTLLKNATTGAEGFNSGPVPVQAGAATAPAWTLEITESTPIWFFCATPTHCQSGMVGSINAAKTGNKTFAAFKSLAMGTTSSNGSPSVVSSDRSRSYGSHLERLC